MRPEGSTAVLAVYQPKEIKMRQNALSILGVLIIAALTVQMATAAPSSARKAGRGHAPAIHQFRDSFGSAPKAAVSESCDRFWCYKD